MIDLHAETLDKAATSATAIAQFPENEFDVVTAYQIQSASIARRLDRGETRVGIKMGFTSRAKMEQMGVHDLIWGRLTDEMEIKNGGVTPFSKYVHPRVEPEICFKLKYDLSGDVPATEAFAAIDKIAPALEIIDSRYENFKFSLPDVIADNASSSGFVIGPWSHPFSEMYNLGIIMSINGRPVQHGSSAAILGDPLESLVNAARLSAAAGEPLQAGWIVMAGAATAAEYLQVGDQVEAEIQNLGKVGFTMT